MPRPKKTVPSYLLHRPSGQAVGPSSSAEPGKHLGQIKNGSLPAPAAGPPGHGKVQGQSRGQGGGNGAANGKGNK